jgi:hypothetical protein
MSPKNYSSYCYTGIPPILLLLFTHNARSPYLQTHVNTRDIIRDVGTLLLGRRTRKCGRCGLESLDVGSKSSLVLPSRSHLELVAKGFSCVPSTLKDVFTVEEPRARYDSWSKVLGLVLKTRGNNAYLYNL